VKELLRFVLAPDGSVVLDLKHKLPGRGVWVSAEAPVIRKAAAKNVFRRALDGGTVDEGFADQVSGQVRRSALSALSMARKAGALVTGFDKVEAAIREGRVAALVHAAEAGRDGVAKLGAALARKMGDEAVPVVRDLTEPELSLAFGRPNVIHAALLAGRASRHALEEIERLARFFGNEPGDATPHLDETSGTDRWTESI